MPGIRGGAARADFKHRAALGDYEKAAALFAETGGGDLAPDDHRRHMGTLLALGDLHVTLGSLEQAAAAFERGLALSVARAAAAPHEPGRQRDMAIAYKGLGDVRRAQGDLAAALDAYRNGLAAAERLAAANPQDASAQRDLSIAHNGIGAALAFQGDLAAALDAYETALAIREHLAAAVADDRQLLGTATEASTKCARRNMAQMMVSDPVSLSEPGLASSSRCDMVDLTVRSPNVRRSGPHR